MANIVEFSMTVDGEPMVARLVRLNGLDLVEETMEVVYSYKIRQIDGEEVWRERAQKFSKAEVVAAGFTGGHLSALQGIAEALARAKWEDE